MRFSFSNVRILTPGPILIPCGGTATINAAVDYTRDEGPNACMMLGCRMVWHYCQRDFPYPFTMYGRLWDDDGIWGWEQYDTTTIVLTQGMPASGTIFFSLQATCTTHPKCKKCLVNGDENEAELFVDVYWGNDITSYTQGIHWCTSGVVKARCTCSGCPGSSRISVHDFPAVATQPTQTRLVLDQSVGPVSDFQLQLNYDSRDFSFGSIRFAAPDSLLAFVNPFPGGVFVDGYYASPAVVPAGEFATLDLLVEPGAAIGKRLVELEGIFRDPIGQDLGVCMADGQASIVPYDVTPPVLNTSQMVFSDFGLYGRPGAVFDDFLGTIPNYVLVEAVVDTGGSPVEGSVHVSPDGSFHLERPVELGGDIPYMFPPGSTARLQISDAQGNSNSVDLTQSPVAVPAAPGRDAGPTGPLPNPSRGETWLTFTLERAAAIEIAIYDVSGRQVRTLPLGTLSDGQHRARWDGRDDAGRNLPAGAYWYQVRGSGSQVRTKVVLLR